MEGKTYNLIIVGAGPAGLSAAIYNLNFTLFSIIFY